MKSTSKEDIYKFFTDFQEKLYIEYGYTMDKLNHLLKYWWYNPLNSDKIYTEIGYHSYHLHYAKKFNDIRHNVKKVLEIGVFRGHSMLMWREYFPNAEIYGVDISYSPHHFGVNAKELCKGKDRIHLYEMDACTPSNVKLLMEEIGECDIIIDDGSHHPLHQLFSLMYYTDYLKQDGIFVVEDVFMSGGFDGGFDKGFLSDFDKPFKIYSKNHYFFNDVIKELGTISNLEDYGLIADDKNKKKLLELSNDWDIDVKEPETYRLTFDDIDLDGNSRTMSFNNRQGIIFFTKKD
jgi:hypothetical protein